MTRENGVKRAMLRFFLSEKMGQAIVERIRDIKEKGLPFLRGL